MKNFLMRRAAGDPGEPVGTSGNAKTFLRAGVALLAAAGLLLGPGVVAVPASAEDLTATGPAATDSTVIDAGIQPLGVAAAPDGHPVCE